MMEVPLGHVYNTNECDKVIRSYFLDDNESTGSPNNGNSSINNFDSANMQSVPSRKSLVVNK
jgi:hypothetical protein